VVAQSQELPRFQIQKILSIYANTIGCLFDMDKKNIVEIDIEGNGDKKLIALYTYDFGYCEGSGSWKSGLAVLEQHKDAQNKINYYVHPEMTMPTIQGIGLPRFIDRIFIKDGQLWFAGRIHAPKDGNNFPTIPVQAQVKLLKTEVKLDETHTGTVYYWKSATDFEGK
jgi:hypothetical protein